MRLLGKMMWVETKLFLREPLTVLFSMILPLTILFVMGGVFGNTVEAGFYRGMGPMDYYTPAYMALVAASVGLISLPTHLAEDRERGVLKRYRASSFPAWTVVGSQVLVTALIALVSALILVSVAMPVYAVVSPHSILRVAVGFVSVALASCFLGVLLGAVLPSPRSAQALGVMLWFVMLMVGGAGPPPEALSATMNNMGKLTPLHHAVRVMQDGWLGLDAGCSWVVIGIVALGCGVAAIRLFRWE